MAVNISTGVFAAMPINIHQRAGQLQNPHLSCCGNWWRQQHSQLLGQTTWNAVHFKGTGLSACKACAWCIWERFPAERSLSQIHLKAAKRKHLAGEGRLFQNSWMKCSYGAGVSLCHDQWIIIAFWCQWDLMRVRKRRWHQQCAPVSERHNYWVEEQAAHLLLGRMRMVPINKQRGGFLLL